jgi:hypothetical protein
VCDEVEFTSPQAFDTALITLSPWKQVADDTLVIGEGAEAVQVKITAGAHPFRIEAAEIHENLPGKIVPQRLAIALTGPVRQAVIRTTIAPLDAAR